MATYQAIAAIGSAIVGVLKAARPPLDFENSQFMLNQSSDLQNSPPMDEGISLYLYRVAINTTKRNWPARIGADGQRFRPSLPIDLHYLLIPWARSATKQHQLLGWSMRALEDTPILSSSLLNRFSTDSETFSPAETVELVSEPISLQDVVNIWDAFKPNLQISVAYVARMILIDSAVALPDGAPVQTRVFDFGKEAVS
ncbi:MAG TPA: DUF4255 domain-containing protein [Ktedonobacteraceae bacterium]